MRWGRSELYVPVESSETASHVGILESSWRHFMSRISKFRQLLIHNFVLVHDMYNQCTYIGISVAMYSSTVLLNEGPVYIYIPYRLPEPPALGCLPCNEAIGLFIAEKNVTCTRTRQAFLT